MNHGFNGLYGFIQTKTAPSGKTSDFIGR